MKRYPNPKRIVTVNTNRRGMIHEPTCKWLAGALSGGSWGTHSPYVDMRADRVPSNKSHCSHCLMSRRVDHTKTVRQWSDDDKAKLQQWLDSTETMPPPTREQVLGAFPELRPKPTKTKP